MIFRRVLIALALLLVGCAGGLVVLLSVDHLRGTQRQIDDGARAIEAATTDAARAAGHIQRGRAYAEIARYRHVMKSIGAAEYIRLYQSAMLDLDAAVRLDPDNLGTFMARGQTYFEHSWTALENRFEPEDAAKAWLVRAKADFTAAIDLDARDETALDYRGMTNERQRDYTAAIGDYTRLTKVNARLGTIRLADVFCLRGTTLMGQKQYDKAVADLEQSISLGTNIDGCDCDPYSPLLWAYFEGLGDFDKSWALVHSAQSNHRWLMPELVEKLKVASSRDH
jgi:tetratricopeptide (TPR) repeat protein